MLRCLRGHDPYHIRIVQKFEHRRLQYLALNRILQLREVAADLRLLVHGLARSPERPRPRRVGDGHALAQESLEKRARAGVWRGLEGPELEAVPELGVVCVAEETRVLEVRVPGALDVLAELTPDLAHTGIEVGVLEVVHRRIFELEVEQLLVQVILGPGLEGVMRMRSAVFVPGKVKDSPVQCRMSLGLR